MYIRIKRDKTTYFIQCEPTETILDIKQKLHVLVDKPVNDQRLILMSEGQAGHVLEDLKTLADQKAPYQLLNIFCLLILFSVFYIMGLWLLIC